MCHADNEKRERSNGRNRTAKSGKHQNAWRKKNYEFLRILEVHTIKQTEIKKKKKSKKRVPEKSKKISRNQALQQKFRQRNKHLRKQLSKYSRPFLKWTREELRKMNQRTKIDDNV